MVRLCGSLFAVAGEKLSHPWDAGAYLLAGEEPVLIDCGSTEGYAGLQRNLSGLGYGPADLAAVFVTHGHWDHCSALAMLRRESGARFYLHEADRARVAQGDPDQTASFLYDRSFPPVEVDAVVRDGEKLAIGGHTLVVCHTPGHTPGSVCYLAELGGLRVLFTGDTLWGGYHVKVDSDLEAWRSSLERLLALDFDALAIGHSSPMLIFDARRKVEEARRQLGVYFNPWFKPFYLDFRY